MPSAKKTIRPPDRAAAWEEIRVLRASIPRHVVQREFASETVLLNVESGIYYGMDEVGVRFFEVLTQSADLQSALELLVKEFEEEEDRIRGDLVAFTTELKDLHLIELAASPPTPTP